MVNLSIVVNTNIILTNHVGKFPFTSHTPGEHTICLYSNTSQWFSGSQLRVHFDIQVGEHAVDYAQVAQKEKLTELQLRIRQLLNQVDQITKEQNYQRVCLGLLKVLFIPLYMKCANNCNFPYSTARNVFVKQVRVQTNEFCGGPWRKLSF